MSDTPADFSPRMSATLGAQKLAFSAYQGADNLAGCIFLPGFKSDMRGTKAAFLAEHLRARQQSYLCFDYFGHGESSGDFADGTISHWRDDVLHMLDTHSSGAQILIGSSFGGWLAVLAALARDTRVAALLLIAPAIDMTERLMWQGFDAAARAQIIEEGVYVTPSEYDAAGYPISRALIEDGRQYCLLDKPLLFDKPVRILHGVQDSAVPWQLSCEFAAHMSGGDVDILLRKSGDHSLSSPADLALLAATLDDLTARVQKSSTA